MALVKACSCTKHGQAPSRGLLLPCLLHDKSWSHAQKKAPGPECSCLEKAC